MELDGVVRVVLLFRQVDF